MCVTLRATFGRPNPADLSAIRQCGQKVFALQTLPSEPDEPRRDVAWSSRFSLHAGIAAQASQRDKLWRLPLSMATALVVILTAVATISAWHLSPWNDDVFKALAGVFAAVTLYATARVLAWLRA